MKNANFPLWIIIATAVSIVLWILRGLGFISWPTYAILLPVLVVYGGILLVCAYAFFIRGRRDNRRSER